MAGGTTFGPTCTFHSLFFTVATSTIKTTAEDPTRNWGNTYGLKTDADGKIIDPPCVEEWKAYYKNMWAFRQVETNHKARPVNRGDLRLAWRDGSSAEDRIWIYVSKEQGTALKLHESAIESVKNRYGNVDSTGSWVAYCTKRNVESNQTSCEDTTTDFSRQAVGRDFNMFPMTMNDRADILARNPVFEALMSLSTAMVDKDTMGCFADQSALQAATESQRDTCLCNLEKKKKLITNYGETLETCRAAITGADKCDCSDVPTTLDPYLDPNNMLLIKVCNNELQAKEGPVYKKILQTMERCSSCGQTVTTFAVLIVFVSMLY